MSDEAPQCEAAYKEGHLSEEFCMATHPSGHYGSLFMSYVISLLYFKNSNAAMQTQNLWLIRRVTILLIPS